MVEPRRVDITADEAEALVQQDDRNVFGTESMQRISAAFRRKVKERGIPVMQQVQQLLSERTDESRSKALALLQSSTPRNPDDLNDARYFSVYWTLGKTKKDEGDAHLALRHFLQAVEQFPSKSRAEHYMLIASLIQELFANGETDAAAVLQRGLSQLSQRVQSATLERLHNEYSKLETGVPRNSASRTPFGDRLPINAQPINVVAGRVVRRLRGN
jgi:tetratricopeptide (TPR) repeat protein